MIFAAKLFTLFTFGFLAFAIRLYLRPYFPVSDGIERIFVWMIAIGASGFMMCSAAAVYGFLFL